MSTYHAVMIDETGCEFGVAVPDQPSREAAYEWLRENYSESRCDQLETPEESRAREDRYYDDARRGISYNEDGRPFFEPGYDDYSDEDDEEEEEEDFQDDYPDE